jgi:hypothetical protein
MIATMVLLLALLAPTAAFAWKDCSNTGPEKNQVAANQCVCHFFTTNAAVPILQNKASYVSGFFDPDDGGPNTVARVTMQDCGRATSGTIANVCGPFYPNPDDLTPLDGTAGKTAWGAPGWAPKNLSFVVDTAPSGDTAYVMACGR